jgi:hypothetical protein
MTGHCFIVQEGEYEEKENVIATPILENAIKRFLTCIFPVMEIWLNEELYYAYGNHQYDYTKKEHIVRSNIDLLLSTELENIDFKAGYWARKESTIG